VKGEVIVVWLETKTRVICKGDTQSLRGKKAGEWGKQNGGCLVFWPLCVWFIFAVVVEGACVRSYKYEVVCTFGTVGYSVFWREG
jgi:hypothetical protein